RANGGGGKIRANRGGVNEFRANGVYAQNK
ncbi:MAG: hypothetical protein ACJAXJ_004200, partial [Colwellia sp.]